MGKTRLLENVESRLGDGFDESRREAIAHSVLYHLWRRLPFHERERMLNALPQDVVELFWEPKNPHEPPMTADQRDREGSIEYDSFDKFCGEVREETQLKGDGQDEEAVHAVFGALKAELPDEEVLHIREMLPQGLQEMWVTARPQ